MKNRGFTLIEVLVVVMILGILAAIVVPRIMDRPDEAKRTAARIDIASLVQALKLYRLDNGGYPSTEQGLVALVQRPGNAQEWNGPYLKGGVVPNDPWGHAYVYRSPVERAPYEIVSFGSDGQEGGTGTAADISSIQASAQANALH